MRLEPRFSQKPRPQHRDGQGPACNHCGMDVDDLGLHVSNHCRETFLKKVHQDLTKFEDLVFGPLGKLTAGEMQRRIEGIAAVGALVPNLPEDSDEHRRRRITYRRELDEKNRLFGVMAGDSQTGGVAFVKKE